MRGRLAATLLLALPGAQEAGPFRAFDETVTRFMEERRIPGGALAVVKDGRLVHARGYGWADPEAKEPVSADSLFRIASISKPVTAVAVLVLVRQGKLDPEARAFALLDLKPHLEPGGKVDPRLETITVRQLLHHTAGWDRDKSGDPMFRPVETAKALGVPAPAGAETVIRFMMGRPLDFDPGARYAYSNLGYCVLGRVIEKVSGEPYEAFVKKAVLEPMGITTMKLGKSLESGRAKGEVRYFQKNQKPCAPVFAEAAEKEVPVPYGGFCLEAMDAHGGWLASAPDLARFSRSLEKVLDAKGLELLFARPPGLKEGAVYYALGWQVRDLGGGKSNQWHSGSLPGTSTLLVRRHDGLSWALLFNERTADSGAIDPLLHKAADSVTEWPR